MEKHPENIPLNELDKLFYGFECVGNPPIQRIHYELRGGSVDIGILRQAYLRLLERYPIANATLEERCSFLKWHACWVPRKQTDEERLVSLCDLSHLSQEAAEERFAEIRFNPYQNHSSFKDPPLSMILFKFPGKNYRLMTFFHHAAVDGYGYFMFFKDMFDTYNQLAANKEPQTKPDEGPIVMGSPLLPTTLRGKLQAIARAMFVLMKIFLKRKGRVPAKLIYGKGTFKGKTAVVHRAFEPQQMKRYISASKHFGTTFTNYFVAAHTLALERWKRGRNEPCGPISVQIHKVLRKSDNEFRETANKFSVFLVMTLPEDRQDPAGLVNCISRQSRSAQENHMAEDLISGSWILNSAIVRKLMVPLGQLLFNNQSIGESFQVGNLGRLWVGPDGETSITHLGDSEITACYMTGYPIPSIGSVTGYCTLGRALFLTFTYWTWAMSGPDAERFVDLIEEVLDELTGLADPSIQ